MFSSTYSEMAEKIRAKVVERERDKRAVDLVPNFIKAALVERLGVPPELVTTGVHSPIDDTFSAGSPRQLSDHEFQFEIKVDFTNGSNVIYSAFIPFRIRISENDFEIYCGGKFIAVRYLPTFNQSAFAAIAIKAEQVLNEIVNREVR